jgi:hypothetical protein
MIEHVNVYVNDLIQGERIVVTENSHGAQFILAHNLEDSKTIVSSKGMLKQGFLLMKPKKVIHTGWLQKMMILLE